MSHKYLEELQPKIEEKINKDNKLNSFTFLPGIGGPKNWLGSTTRPSANVTVCPFLIWPNSLPKKFNFCFINDQICFTFYS